MNKTEDLFFFITSNKLTNEFIIQESDFVSLKIPHQWQKPDSNIENPALWVCHLPTNSLGMTYISLYPNKLVIKKIDTQFKERDKNWLKEGENIEKYEENFAKYYEGVLEPNGENEKEKFYRCMLKLQEKKNEYKLGVGFWIFLIFIIIITLIVFSFFLANFPQG